MSIHDFHSKLNACDTEGTLLETLRKLSAVENLQILLGEDEITTDWGIWSDLSPTGAQ
jgi:hypothetical protein